MNSIDHLPKPVGPPQLDRALRKLVRLHDWFGGRTRVRLKHKDHTELPVARNQVKTLKERLGLR